LFWLIDRPVKSMVVVPATVACVLAVYSVLLVIVVVD